MNWKEVPHLFANGKFKVKVENFDNPVSFTPYWLREITREEPMPKCTLIARKIEDMTDEELEEIDWDESLQSHYSKYSLEAPAWIFLYLLSIGVYPFDQEAFEIGEVLDEKVLS